MESTGVASILEVEIIDVVSVSGVDATQVGSIWGDAEAVTVTVNGSETVISTVGPTTCCVLVTCNVVNCVDVTYNVVNCVDVTCNVVNSVDVTVCVEMSTSGGSFECGVGKVGLIELDTEMKDTITRPTRYLVQS